MRTTLLFAALTVSVALILAVTVLTAVAVRAAVRRSRVHPDIETGVPLAWSWWPSPPARYHRRLRAAVGPIAVPPTRRRVPPPLRRRAGAVPASVQLGPVLVYQAVAVDRELLLAARLPRPARRAAVLACHRDVARIERLGRVFRREGLAAAESPLPPCGPARDAVLDAVELRLRHLREAHDELRALEADAAVELRGDVVPVYPAELRTAG